MADSIRFDSLKHLRLVHFTIVVTSVVLLVGASLESPYKLRQAFEEVSEIYNTKEDLLKFINDYTADKYSNRNVKEALQDKILTITSPIFKNNIIVYVPDPLQMPTNDVFTRSNATRTAST